MGPDAPPPAARPVGLADPADAGAKGAVPAFGAIYAQYFDFVWSSARRLGVGSGAIDDVVQEVFVVIHTRIHTLERPEALRSWIYSVVRRTVSTYHRDRKVHLATGTENVRETCPPTPLELAEQTEEVRLLGSLLAQLDDAKREVFVLAELEEMPVPEIAEAIGIPLNTAYSRLRLARAEFDRALARHTASEVSGGGRRCLP